MRRLLGACVVVGMVVAWACGSSGDAPAPPVAPSGDLQPPDDPPRPDSGTPEPDSGTPPRPDAGHPPGPDAGDPPDAGTPDAGTPDAGTPDAGTPPGGPGPWPNEPMVNYTQRYGLGRVRSVGVDDAHNIWLLEGARIGVLRPGETRPRWVSGIGQARQGFGPEALAMGSTVICGQHSRRR